MQPKMGKMDIDYQVGSDFIIPGWIELQDLV